MPTSILVIDDFLENADPLRQAALQLTYPEQQGAFPGRNSLQRLAIPGLERQISDVLGEPLEAPNPPHSHGKCRITLAADKGRGRVHVDPSHWSGILYLSRPEDCRGGTQFFRHKRTGADRMPLDPAELRALGYSTFEEMHADIIAQDGADETKWELTMEVPMRFNRLLLLRPWLWHTAGPAFGDTMENGRLVYLMFFNSAAR